MNLISFNLTKMNIEKNKSNFKDLKIDSSIDLESINEVKNNVIKSEKTFLSVKFKYDLNYAPEIASINFKGIMGLSLDSEDAKEVLKDWKEKKVKDKFKLAVFNTILRKCNIKAVQLEDEFGLPLHFKLPSLSIGNKK